jgi:methylmalonyl-CoA mutase
MFESFGKQEESLWFKLLEKELKNQSLETLYGKWEERISYKPFYLKDPSSCNERTITFFPNKYQVGAFYIEAILLSYPEALKSAIHNDVKFIGVTLNSPFNPSFLASLLAEDKTEDLLFYFTSESSKDILIVQDYLSSLKSNATGYKLAYDYLSPLLERRESGTLATGVQQFIESSEQLITLPNFVESLNLATLDIKGAFSYQVVGFFLYYLKNIWRKLTKGVSTLYLRAGMGNNLFLEIAKLRAIRIIWERTLLNLQLPSIPLFIIGQTSPLYLTRLQEVNNLVRTTLSTLSGILGGCNTIAVLPYTITPQDNFIHADRWARNIQHLLIHESGLSKVVDPLAGSYYIENLTQQILEAAQEWSFLLEAKGGILNLAGCEFLMQELDKAKLHKAQKVLQGVTPIIGNTLYRGSDCPPLSNLTVEELEKQLSTLERLPQIGE